MNIKSNRRAGSVGDLLKRYNYKFYLKLMFAGILTAIASKFFIIYANIFSPGVAGVAQGISYTLYDAFGHTLDGALSDPNVFNNVVYWIIYAVMNVPIIWFTYVKFGKEFSLRSMVVLMSSLAFTMFLTFTPGVSDAAFIPGYDPVAATPESMFAISSLAGVFGGLIYGFGVGLAFKEGVSSMGFDPVAKYLQRDKGMNIRTVLFTVAFINSVIWIFVSAGMNNQLNTVADFFQVLISPRVLGSILFLGTYAAMSSAMASHKPLRAEITTFKGKDVTSALKEGFERTFTISDVTGGYSSKKAKKIEVVLYAVEVEDVMHLISKADPTAFVVTFPVDKVYAQFKSAQSKAEKAIDKHREQRKVKKQTAKKK